MTTNHTDLIRRLRTRPTGDPHLHALVHEAADALEAMQADAARLEWIACNAELKAHHSTPGKEKQNLKRLRAAIDAERSKE